MLDKTYQTLPLGREAAEYLRLKSKRLTPTSYRGYEGTLAALAFHYPETALVELEPPHGTRLLEDFLAGRWGDRNPKTYNKNLTVLRDFCKWQVLRGRLHGDPTLPIERAKPRAFHRSTFTSEQRYAILEANPDPRYRVALRLLLDFGIRKGALGSVRFEHFDHEKRRLVIFTKGGRIHQVPIPVDSFWADVAAIGAQPSHYLLCKQRVASPSARTKIRVDALAGQVEAALIEAETLEGPGARLVIAKLQEARELLRRPALIGEVLVSRDPEQALAEHGMHDWWYRCLARAGVVAEGVTRGERMHKARHTAGQRVLDKTGNLKATQELLGHSSIATTGNSYTGWGIDQLSDTMRQVVPS